MSSTARRLVLSVLLLFFLALPLAVQHGAFAYILRLLGIMGLYMILALGLNVTLGFVGLFDLGFMAFYAIGAYTSALLSIHGIGFWLATSAAVLVTVTVRLLFGAPGPPPLLSSPPGLLAPPPRAPPGGGVGGRFFWGRRPRPLGEDFPPPRGQGPA